MTDQRIDGGKAFDWGKTSADYAKYRDIYPPEFYDKILSRGLCRAGSRVLDLGTGTGVLPRHLARYGAEWVGTDISENQIEQAKRLSAEAGLSIAYLAVPAEKLPYEAGSFDTITACQCFWYFDHAVVMPRLAQLLRDGGKLVVLYMAWLPYEDAIAGASEELVLRYNPSWSGAGETRHPIWIPDVADEYFRLTDHEEFDLNVPFTRESWHGRMKACRGVGASLSPEELSGWERDHKALLDRIAPDTFDVKHYGAIAVLEKK
ncbi:MAG: methyltransferase domain-containing protein [Oscillospiraceae bacterium]|nr:methyltransferase domain-containing protein [Oscillospiraceae bacterium]